MCLIFIDLPLFLNQRLEQTNFIFAALALSDNGFLLTILFYYLKNYDYMKEKEWMCKANVYLNYVFIALSSWFLVVLSVERAAYFFDRRLNICTTLKKKSIVVIIIIMSFLFYSYALVTTSVEISDSKEVACVPIKKWLSLVKIMSAVDSFLAILIPFILILISNTLVGFKLIDHSNRYSSSLKLRVFDQHRRKKVRKIPKITKILFCLSSTFLVLNFPIAFLKIWNFLKSNDFQPSISMTKKDLPMNYHQPNEETNQTHSEEIIERIAFYLYYLNFSINFFLFTINESKFSERLWSLFRQKSEYHHTGLAVVEKSSAKVNTIKITML